MVNKIVFNGLDRIEKNTTLHRLGLKTGTNIERSEINKLVKKLYLTGYFSSINIKLSDDGTLKITVVENPMVNEVILGGVQSKIGDIIKQELSLKSRTVYSKEKLKSDTEKITFAFRKSGKMNTTVSPKIEVLSRNRVNVLFDVKDSPPSRIGSILLLDNYFLSDIYILNKIKNKGPPQLFPTMRGKVFEEDSLDIDKTAIVTEYVNNGFVDASINHTLAEYDSSTSEFALTFGIEEGDRYRFGAISVESDTKIDMELLNDATIYTVQGGLYKQVQINKTISSLTRALQNNGYAFVTIDPSIDADSKMLVVNIRYIIKEAKPAYIGTIRIFGNTRSDSKTIMQELTMKEGDLYNKSLIERAKEKLLVLGYYDFVEIKERRTSSEDLVDLDVLVQDRKQTGQISGSIGYSSLEFILLQFGISKANLMGKGIGVSLSTMLSGWRRQVTFSISKSHIMGSNATLSLNATYMNINPLNISLLSQLPPYIQNSVSTSLNLSYPIVSRVFQAWGLQYRYDTLGYSRALSGLPSLYLGQITNVTMSTSLVHSISYEGRDNPLLPTRGFFASLTTSIGLPLPYQIQYISNDLFAGLFIPIVNNDWVFSILLKAGNSNLYSDPNGYGIPFQYRHPLGYYDFPGFNFAGVGPHVATTTYNPDGTSSTNYYPSGLRGQYYWVANFTLRMPSPLKAYGVHFTASLTVGSSWGVPDNLPRDGSKVEESACKGNYCTVNSDKSISVQYVVDTALPRMSLSAGILWMSGMGPIWLEFGYAVVSQVYDTPLYIRLNFTAMPI